MPVLIWFILLSDVLLRRKPTRRAADVQARIDDQTASMRLYHFRACPFCRKARRDIDLLALRITAVDIKLDPKARNDLIAGGGKKQVPCLRIDEAGSVRWLYESRDIANYLRARFT